MFEEMVVSSPNPKKTNKPWTVFVSMLLQVVFLGILILIPLIYTEALPKTMMATMLTAPPPPPPPPPPPAAVQVVHIKPQVHLMDAGKLVARRRGRDHRRRGHCASSAKAQADWAGACRRQRASRAPGEQSSAGLSAVGAPDAHLRHRASACHHQQGWHHSIPRGCQRPSAAAAKRSRCRSSVALSADSPQRRAGRSGHDDRRDFLSEPVVRSGVPVVGQARLSGQQI